jgi:hypothetical protein
VIDLQQPVNLQLAPLFSDETGHILGGGTPETNRFHAENHPLPSADAAGMKAQSEP